MASSCVVDFLQEPTPIRFALSTVKAADLTYLDHTLLRDKAPPDFIANVKDYMKEHARSSRADPYCYS